MISDPLLGNAAYLPKLFHYISKILYFYLLQGFCANGACVAREQFQKNFSTMIMAVALFVLLHVVCYDRGRDHAYALPR